MEYKVRKDSAYGKVIFFSFLIIVISVSAPFLYSFCTLSALDIAILILLLVTLPGILIWFSYGITYRLYDDYLYVRGGLFYSRIPYNKITQIHPVRFTTLEMLTGYRILASRDGIEILYNKGIGVIKISPEEKELFLEELEKRCPGAKLIDKSG